jgi:peptide/nickel transport system substrate-binding protein
MGSVSGQIEFVGNDIPTALLPSEEQRGDYRMPVATAQEGVPMREDIQRYRGPRKHRRNVMSKCLSVALLAVLISSALLVFPMSSAPVKAAPVVMTVGTTLVPDTFNPFSMMSGTSWTATHFMYERLVTDDPVNRQPVPMLAQSWETSPDGKVWTFHLVHNSIWHDNIPVTAEDVNFTYNLILDNPRECGLYSNYVTNITDVRALDDYTVRFTTDVPKATMLSMWVPILPKHLWSAVPINRLQGVDMWSNVFFPNGPIGSGPMILDSYDRTLGEIRFLKWDKYHMGTINVDEVLFKVFSSEDPMMTALDTGSIDLAMYVPNNLWETTLASDVVDGQVADAFVLNELGINCASPSLKFATDSHGNPLFPKASQQTETWNLSVRQAVAMAINKTQLVHDILKDLGDKGDTLIPPITPFWKYNVPENEEWKFNLERANATLDAAGYRDTDGDHIRENASSGARLDFTFYYITGVAADELAADKISKWLLEIGINAPPIPTTETLMYQIAVNMKADMYLWNWWPDPDPSFILSVMTTAEIPADNGDMSAWQDAMYSNPVYDQMFIQQQSAVNLTERQTIVREMQRILYHDCPYVVLWYPYSLFAYRLDRFTNYPDFAAEPGATPDNFWYYFEVGLIGSNIRPEAEAGPDRTAYLGEVLSFTGSATDMNDPISSLSWKWTFEEPTGTPTTLTGRTVDYTFDHLGTVTVTLNVTDPGGLWDVDTLTVTVIPVPANAGWVVGYVNSSRGVAIAGATVTDGTLLRTTDTSGFYNLTLLPGAYSVNVSAPGHLNATAEVTVVAYETTWLNITLTATAWSLNGHVYDSKTRGAIAGATVKLFLANATVLTQMTNDAGYYEMLDIAFGTYTVRVQMAGYESNETTLTVTTSLSKTQDFDLTPSGGGGGGGLSTTAIAAIGAVAALVIAGVLAGVLLKRRRAGEPPKEPPTTQ